MLLPVHDGFLCFLVFLKVFVHSLFTNHKRFNHNRGPAGIIALFVLHILFLDHCTLFTCQITFLEHSCLLGWKYQLAFWLLLAYMAWWNGLL